MKLVTTPVRSALATLLSGIPFMGKTINAFEEYLQESTTKKKSVLTIGSQQVTAYIILLNQTVNDNSSKCMRNDETSIQVQITTVYPPDTGGSLIGEQISDLVLAKLFNVDNMQITGINLPGPFEIWRARFVSSRNINYNTDTNRVWVTQLTLSFSINQ